MREPERDLSRLEDILSARIVGGTGTWAKIESYSGACPNDYGDSVRSFETTIWHKRADITDASPIIY